VKRLLWACAGLSLGLHLALAIAWQPHPTPAATAALKRLPLARLQGRLVVLPQAPRAPAPPAQPREALAPALAPAPAGRVPATAAAPAAQPPAALAPAADDGLAAADLDPAQPADTPPIHSGPVAATATAAGWDDYLPRAQLTVAPSPREPIPLDYPADGPAIGRFVLTLTLYIDEAGAVRRVDVAGDEALPDALRQAARASFIGQRFSPGERADGVVKSRIRIEALYESLALPKFAAYSAVLDSTTAH
jgi:hypothetical protein